MTPSRNDKRRRRQGFTLVEVMVSIFIVMLTLAAALALFISYRHTWVVASLARVTSSETSAGLERIVYGVGTNSGLREAMLSTVSASYPAGGWQLDYNTNRFLSYSPATSDIVDENGNVICDNVIDSDLVFTNRGCLVSITTGSQGGGRTATNMMSSFIQFRN
jgi:type II secretory pathway pseudopilin PulG